MTVTVTAPASGSLTNVASVSSPTGDPNLTNNVTPPVITTVTAVADVGIGNRPASVVAREQPGLHDIGDELWPVECERCGGDRHAAGGSDVCECDWRRIESDA